VRKDLERHRRCTVTEPILQQLERVALGRKHGVSGMTQQVERDALQLSGSQPRLEYSLLEVVAVEWSADLTPAANLPQPQAVAVVRGV
jgi:hypothetical protein